MKRICSLSITSGLVSFIFLLVGCDSPPTAEPITSYATGMMDETSTVIVPAATVPQDDPESSAADERRKRIALKDDRVVVLVERFIENGKALLEQNKLEEAQNQFAHALELLPGDEEARELFNRTSSLLGERTATISEISRQARERTVVRKAQNRMKAEELLKQARVFMENGEFDKAIRSLEDAMTIIRWNPYLDDGDLAESNIMAELSLARERREEDQLRREKDIQERIFKQKEEMERAEQDRLANRIRRLSIDANNAFLNDRYRHCELCLEELLKLDPENADALDLLALAVKARHDREKELSRTEYKRQWRKTFDEIEFTDLPPTELLSFPSEEKWTEVVRRGRTELAIKEETTSPEDEEIHQRLATTSIPIQFEQTTLEEMVDYFKATTGVNFIISQGIIESGEEPLFDLITPPRPAIKQLDLLLSMASPVCKYNIQNGVVTILLAEEAIGNYVLDVYDIRDLSKVIADFPAKDFNLSPSGDAPLFEEADEDGDDIPDVVASDLLVELIRDNIEPLSWEDDVNNTINVIGNYLVVRQNPKIHEKINQLLTDLRKSVGVLINIETRFITVEDNFLQDIGVDFRGLNGHAYDFANPLASVPNVLLDDFGDASSGGYGTPSTPGGIGTGNDAGIYYDDGRDGDIMGRIENLLDLQIGEDDVLDGSGGTTLQFTFLDDTAISAILRAVEKSSQSNIVQAPSVTVYNGQRAHLTAITHTAYIKDFETEIAQASVIAEPIVDIVREGIVLDVKPVVSSDRRFITMELRPTIATLKRESSGEFRTLTTSLAVGESVTIELPELEIKRLRTTIVMPDRSTLLLGGMKISNYRSFDTGLPFFRHIPILSFLLSRKATYQSKRKLLILVKGTIVIPEEDEPLINAAG